MKNTLKKSLSIILAILMIVSAMPFAFAADLAASGTCGDNVTYTYDSETGELIISGTGAMTDYSEDGSPFCNSAIKTVVIEDGVTSIGTYAFALCESLESVTIPDSVTSIGGSAFECCGSLASIEIPDGVTSIGDYAFSNCTNLTSVTIPDSVTSIGSYAFADCTSLESVTIPDSVTSIGDYAFWDCTSLASVTIGNSVTSIGDHAFYGCKSLTSVTIGNSVTSIGGNTFGWCPSLTSVSVPCTWNENPLYSVEVTVRDHSFTDGTCTVCSGNCETLGHDMQETTATVDPTCETAGNTAVYTCVNGCGKTEGGEKIEALGHSFTNYIESEAASCEVNAKETASCDNGCGETYTREVEDTARGHDINDDVYVAPTCTETGLTEGSHCSRCDDMTVAQEEIEALGHSFTDYIEIEAAKCGVNAKETAACNNGCGATDTREVEDTALSHADANGDYICDNGCGYEFEKPVDPTPDEPDTPDEPADTDCDHICHSNNAFVQFIWKIVNFIQKIFGIQQYCDCGIAHW